MPGPGRRFKPKHDEQQRRKIAERYHAWLRNKPKVLIGEYGITDDTLRKYAREFQ